jgi:hypothetical protein
MVVGCADHRPPGSTQAARSADVTPSEEELRSIRVLVTFVGGPADGVVELRPLSEITKVLTISGVDYRSNPGPPPEVIQTDEGGAEVFRPIRHSSR